MPTEPPPRAPVPGATVPRVTTEVDGHVFKIGLNRADKMNAFDLRMLRELSEAYTTFEDDDALLCALVFAHGAHFTAGLDLAEVGPAVAGGAGLFPDGCVNPIDLHGRRRTKPVVFAIHGYCLTIGIELTLAGDIAVAAEGAKFGQIEINRGIFPFGGATIRLPQRAGWGNAMRWLLTGDTFGPEEALRLGLVQEVHPEGAHLEAALAIAHTVARRAPLGVRETLANARIATSAGTDEAADALLPAARRLMDTDDAAEGLRSFVERREAVFTGK